MPKNGLFFRKKKKCKNRRSVAGLSLQPPLASDGSTPDPSYCSHILLQLRNLKAFVGGTQKYFASKHRGTLATLLVIWRHYMWRLSPPQWFFWLHQCWAAGMKVYSALWPTCLDWCKLSYKLQLISKKQPPSKKCFSMRKYTCS